MYISSPTLTMQRYQIGNKKAEGGMYGTKLPTGRRKEKKALRA